MSIKAKLEAIIYAAEEPVTLDQMAALLKEDLLALKTAVAPQNAEAVAPASEPAPDSARAAKSSHQRSEKTELRDLLRPYLEELIADSSPEDRGIEVRQVAGGYRMSTKPEHHDVVRAFARSLKHPIRLSLPALETLAVIAYKQPVTVPEISDIRGVDASGVIGTLLERKLITTAGRKAVVGRPMLYKTSKDFLLRFGLKDLSELPSLEEFEKLAAAELLEEPQAARAMVTTEATGIPGGRGAAQTIVSSERQRDHSDEQAAEPVPSESSRG